MADYKLFLSEATGIVQRPEEGKEIEVEIINAETLERQRVRAVLSPDPAKLPETEDRIWLYQGASLRPLEEKPWAIKILEFVEEEKPTVTAPRPKDVSLGKMRGHMLEHLIRERERREGEQE